MTKTPQQFVTITLPFLEDKTSSLVPFQFYFPTQHKLQSYVTKS